jgi:hypothetical protein
MVNKSELIPIILVLCMVVAAFLAGMLYERQREIPIQTVCYDRVGGITNVALHTLNVNNPNNGLYIVPEEMQGYNATACWIGLR